MRRFMLCILGAWLWVSGALAASPPKPVESEWLVTESGTFFISGDPKGRDGQAQYVMKYNLRKPVTEKLYVTVDFEDPKDEESPLFAEFELAPGTTTFEARSELIPAIRNRHKYLVKVWIYADVKRKQLLGTHEQWVLFDMPRALLEELGIEIL